MTDYTSFYAPIETGIIDRLRYSLKNDFLTDKLDLKVSGNESNLNRGYDYFIVVMPGQFPTVNFIKSKEIQDVDFDTRLELFVRFRQADEQWSRFTAFRDAVIYHIWNNRYLRAVTIAGEAISEVTGVDSVRDVTTNGDAEYYQHLQTQVTFMTQPLIVTTRRRVRFDA